MAQHNLDIYSPAKARGRNGYFVPKTIDMTTFEDDGIEVMSIAVYSRRMDGSPPVYLKMDAQDWGNFVNLTMTLLAGNKDFINRYVAGVLQRDAEQEAQQ